MTLWKSTLNAPLEAEEEERILEAWYRLEALCAAQSELSDPIEMLEHITDVVLCTYEVRRAIMSGWNAANARAFPTPTRTQVGSSRLLLQKPLDDITAEDVETVLNNMRLLP